MIGLIVSLIGAGLAILYVGFLAIKVAAIPLIVITAIFLVLMVWSLYEDWRNDQHIAQYHADRKDNGG